MDSVCGSSTLRRAWTLGWTSNEVCPGSGAVGDGNNHHDAGTTSIPMAHGEDPMGCAVNSNPDDHRVYSNRNTCQSCVLAYVLSPVPLVVAASWISEDGSMTKHSKDHMYADVDKNVTITKSQVRVPHISLLRCGFAGSDGDRCISHTMMAPKDISPDPGGKMMIHAKCNPTLKFLGIGLVILCAVASPTFAQKAEQELPIVIGGNMPLYPLIANHARIQGVVKIKVTTDGEKVTSLEAESGPPMLVQAAKKNILTWRFLKHRPTTFVTTFEYVIKDPDQCMFSNSSSVLNLPLKIQISAKGLETCDPGTENKPHS